MDGVTIPFLPTGLWLFAAALAIILIFLSFVHYLYYRRRIQAVVEEGKNAADLAAERERLQADVDSLREWIDSQRDEINRLKAEREEQERLRAVLDNLMQQAAVQDQKNELLRREVGDLENQRHMVTQALEKLKQEIGDLEAKREEASALRRKLTELKSEVDKALQSLVGLAGVEAKHLALNAELSVLKQKVADLQTEKESAVQETEANRREAAETLREVETAKSKLARLHEERARLEVLVNTLRGEQGALEHDLSQIEALIEKSKKYENEARTMLENLKQTRIQRLQEQERIDDLRTRKAILEQRVRDLEGRLDGGPGDSKDMLTPYADLLEVPSECMSKAIFTGGKHDIEEEWAALQHFRELLRADDLKFSDRVIYAFHTSLKCHDINPLTVLAGVSGTGKTLMPIYYAGIMGMHSLVMAIQPRWDSPQDMFGFYNYIEKQYKATELSRALVLMDPYNQQQEAFMSLDGEWTRDRMLIVLLDEMNIARTEYYFSEFLSKLELRRMVKNPDSFTDRERAEIELDAGPSLDLRFRFWVGRNVLFVGTMNEDETTQTLSDKVLDRANVLRFGKPDGNTMPAQTEDQRAAWSDQYLSFETWQSWQQKYDDGAPWYDEVVHWTKSLNEALDRVGRPFGYRVQQAVTTYVANYPLVEQGDRYKLAFADQIEQKIIPKLRGVEIGDQNANECLNKLQDIIEMLGDNALVDAFQQTRDESEQLGLFQWRGVTRAIEDDE